MGTPSRMYSRLAKEKQCTIHRPGGACASVPDSPMQSITVRPYRSFCWWSNIGVTICPSRLSLVKALASRSNPSSARWGAQRLTQNGETGQHFVILLSRCLTFMDRTGVLPIPCRDRGTRLHFRREQQRLQQRPLLDGTEWVPLKIMRHVAREPTQQGLEPPDGLEKHASWS